MPSPLLHSWPVSCPATSLSGLIVAAGSIRRRSLLRRTDEHIRRATPHCHPDQIELATSHVIPTVASLRTKWRDLGRSGSRAPTSLERPHPSSGMRPRGARAAQIVTRPAPRTPHAPGPTLRSGTRRPQWSPPATRSEAATCRRGLHLLPFPLGRRGWILLPLPLGEGRGEGGGSIAAIPDARHAAQRRPEPHQPSLARAAAPPASPRDCQRTPLSPRPRTEGRSASSSSIISVCRAFKSSSFIFSDTIALCQSNGGSAI